MNNKSKLFIFFLMVFTVSLMVATTPEAKLQGQMQTINDAFLKFTDSSYKDLKYRDYLLKNLPELIKNLEKSTLSMKAPHFRRLLAIVYNPYSTGSTGGTGAGQSTAGGTTTTNTNTQTGQTTTIINTGSITVLAKDLYGQGLKVSTIRIELYRDGNLFLVENGPSHTFSNLIQGDYQVKGSVPGLAVTARSPVVNFDGKTPDWHRTLTLFLNVMKIKVYIREFGKVDLLTNAETSINEGPYHRSATGLYEFIIDRPGLYRLRAKAPGYLEVIRECQVDTLTSFKEVWLELIPLPR